MTTIKPRTANVTIYQGDDIARLSELYRAAESAKKFEAASFEDARAGDDLPAVAQERQDAYDAFVDEAAERAVTIELHSIGKRRFRDLMAQHPPRMVAAKVDPPAEGETAVVPELVTHEDDAGFEVNTTTFPDALLTYIDSVGPTDAPVARTIAAPLFVSSAAVQSFIDDEISDGDYDGLWTTAYYLNRGQSADPKAVRYSPGSRSSDAT